MDSYKAKFPVLDPAQAGFVTQGEARVFSLTLCVNDSPVDISAVDSFELAAPGEEATVIIPTADIQNLDDALDPDLKGRIDVAAAETVTAKLLSGRSQPFTVKAITNSVVAIYWGELCEVRKSL